jgi:hypothetical protein
MLLRRRSSEAWRARATGDMSLERPRGYIVEWGLGIEEKEGGCVRAWHKRGSRLSAVAQPIE